MEVGSSSRWRGQLSEALTSPTAKRAYFVLLVLVVLFLWWNMTRRAVAARSSQFDDWVRICRDLVFDGVNVYREYEPGYTITKYPPFFAFLFVPLVFLPPWVGASAWFFLNLACGVGVARVGVRVVEKTPGEGVRRPSLVWVPFALASGVVISNLETAQVNLVILMLIVSGLYAFRRRREWTAGAVLGFATALKLTPGLLVAYFVYKKAWRVAAGAAVALVVCWVVIPTVTLGSSHTIDLYRSWLEIVTPFVREGTSAEGVMGFRHTNQSLSAAVFRFLTETEADAHRGEFYVNVASLSLETARAIVLSLSVAAIVGLLWLLRTPSRERDRVAFSFETSLILITALLINPISWINHYVALLFPLTVAVYAIASGALPARSRRILTYAAAIVTVGLVGSISLLWQAYSLPFAGAVILGGTMAVVLRRASRSPVRETGVAGPRLSLDERLGPF